MKGNFVLYGLLFVTLSSFLPGLGFEGDSLIYYLGKPAAGNDVKQLKAHYNSQMANETHYLSTGGIELILKNGSLSEINLYQKSAVYGNYTSLLPGGLRFGTLPSEVKSKLGRPTLSYNSGYCEFDYQSAVISCWFEGGRLNQVGLSLKNG